MATFSATKIVAAELATRLDTLVATCRDLEGRLDEQAQANLTECTVLAASLRDGFTATELDGAKHHTDFGAKPVNGAACQVGDSIVIVHANQFVEVTDRANLGRNKPYLIDAGVIMP